MLAWHVQQTMQTQVHGGTRSLWAFVVTRAVGLFSQTCCASTHGDQTLSPMTASRCRAAHCGTFDHTVLQCTRGKCAQHACG